ncbi:MAG: hypothetical protein WD766_13765, partial [Gemmatimonadota bacterium]
MMRIGNFIAAAPFVALLGGCAGSLPEIPADLVAELGDVVVEDSLQNTASGWAISGVARLVDIPRFSSMQVQVEAAGLTPGPHGWHIHNGQCASPGGVVVPLSAIGAQPGIDEPLVAGDDGAAAEDAIVPASLLSRAQVEAG